MKTRMCKHHNSLNSPNLYFAITYEQKNSSKTPELPEPVKFEGVFFFKKNSQLSEDALSRSCRSSFSITTTILTLLYYISNYV